MGGFFMQAKMALFACRVIELVSTYTDLAIIPYIINI
jgi:hypothetical protein